MATKERTATSLLLLVNVSILTIMACVQAPTRRCLVTSHVLVSACLGSVSDENKVLEDYASKIATILVAFAEQIGDYYTAYT